MTVLVPFGGAIVSLSRGAVDLARSVMASDSAKNALLTVVSGSPSGDAGGEAGPFDILKSPGKIVALVQEHGAVAAQIFGNVAGAAVHAVLGFFVFFYAVYVFLVDGPDYYEWLAKHAPIEMEKTRRLAAAFNETGRGLFIGVGLTGRSSPASGSWSFRPSFSLRPSSAVSPCSGRGGFCWGLFSPGSRRRA